MAKKHRHKLVSWIRFACLLLSFCSATHAIASVKGACSNCHTMHNSQDGATLSGSTNESLLVSDCVGCHSSTGPETIITLGESRIPIVYNTTAYPAQPLAGGNFFHVAQGGAENDVYGHNVYGISGVDNNLSSAPGGLGCASSCHRSLAKPKEEMVAASFDGCQSCHQKPKHHGETVAPGQLETHASGNYRFLNGHEPGGYVFWVDGIEDPDWEQNPAAGHNVYQDISPTYDDVDMSTEHTVTTFCAACHGDYHGYFDIVGGGPPFALDLHYWTRHPTTILLPESGEYAAYDPVSNYDATVPVGWVNPLAPQRSEAVVMCLSCHRAHGSQYPDMLRWDYSNTVAGGGDSNEGCFKCHSSKDA